MTQFSNNIREYKHLLRYDQLCEFEIEYGFTDLFYDICDGTLFLKKADHRNGTVKELRYELTDGSACHESILEDFMVNLLSYSGNFYGTPVFEDSPVFSRDKFNQMFDSGLKLMKERIEKAIVSNQANELITYCKSIKLNPEPEGSAPTNWKANCPSGRPHYIMISTFTNEWGCGYCRCKGDINAIREWYKSFGK